MTPAWVATLFYVLGFRKELSQHSLYKAFQSRLAADKMLEEGTLYTNASTVGYNNL